MTVILVFIGIVLHGYYRKIGVDPLNVTTAETGHHHHASSDQVMPIFAVHDAPMGVPGECVLL